MRDSMNRECDPVLYSNLSHQLRYVGLYRTFFDAQGRADFLVGTAGNQHLQYFFFAVGKGHAARRKDTSRR